MTKTELITAVSEKTGLSKTSSRNAIEAMLGIISDTLSAGNKVQITGFGTFNVRARAAKTAANPRTKEKITVPARKAPAFKAGTILRAAVDN